MNPFENFERNSFSPERNILNIEGFDEYSDLSKAEVEGIIKDLVPEDHLEKCENITCSVDRALWDAFPEALGLYNIETRDITLASSKVFDITGENEIEVLFHEIGHNAHAVLMDHNPEAASEWAELHESTLETNALDGFGFVSEYAKTDVYEDFAESYSQYIANPALLEFMSPEKYAFMKTQVYDGREYGRVTVGSGQYAMYEKSVADALQAAVRDAGVDSRYTTIEVGGKFEPIKDTYRCFSIVASSAS